jgi:hypothetical protein
MIKKGLVFCFLLCESVFCFSSSSDIEIIKKYYNYMSNRKHLKDAYEMSSKKTDYNTFYSWYKDIAKINLGDIRENADGSYGFIVTIINHVPSVQDRVESAVYEVKMIVSNGKIEKSISRQIFDYVVMEKDINNDYKIKIIDDTKNSKFIVNIISTDNKIVNSEEYKYFDEWRYDFSIEKITTSYFYIKVQGFEYFNYVYFDFATHKFYKPAFNSILSSDDGKIILSYANYNYGGMIQGLELFYYNGFLKKLLTNNGASNPTIKLIDNEYWVVYNEYESGDDTKLIGEKKINLSSFVK